MLGRSRKNRLYVFTGNDQLSLLVEVAQPGNPRSTLEVLGQTDTSPDVDVSLPRLLTTAASARGAITVVLPLHFFETVSISLPPIPDSAIAKALPYQLAKSVSKPIGEYIYDWQITERLKDRLQLMVYLYNSTAFNKMRAALPNGHLEIKYIEPDVFAACALLEKEQRLVGDHASLIILVWQNNISLAVYDQNRLVLVRNIPISQPPPATDETEPMPDETVPKANQPTTNAEPELLFDITAPDLSLESITADSAPASESSAVAENAIAMNQDQELHLTLAGWNIFTPDAIDDDRQPAATANSIPTENSHENAAHAVEPTTKGRRQDYCQQIGLEIMRTRDYYVSVMKGRQINRIYLGCDDSLRHELNACNQEFLGLDLLPLYEENHPDSESFPHLLRSLVLGAGIR